MANGKKVRDYVTPDDSTAIVDYLIDFFNRPDVPELYSKQVAGIPVKEVHDRYEGKYLMRLDHMSALYNEHQ